MRALDDVDPLDGPFKRSGLSPATARKVHPYDWNVWMDLSRDQGQAIKGKRSRPAGNYFCAAASASLNVLLGRMTAAVASGSGK